jgi:hypothetical protein
VITHTQDPAQVRAAIGRALQERQFAVEAELPGKMRVRMDHRGVQLRLDILYTGQQYSIEYIDSVGLGYQVDPNTGTPTISRNFGRYVARLEASIQEELERPAREAAEALEEQREHQLAMEQARSDRDLALAQAQHNERERQRQAELEAERLRTERAQAEVAAEYVRRLPPPTIVGVQPVSVSQFQFEAAQVEPTATVLHPGFRQDPTVLTGRVAGRTPSQRLGLPETCAGHWAENPQQVLQLPNGMRYLRVDAMATEDITLAVVTPDGQVWCDDDGAGGTNARLAGTFPPGTYAVFVGTYERGRRTDYAVSLSEHAPPAQGQVVVQAAQPAPQPAPPDCRQAVLAAGHAGAHLVHCQNAEPYCAAALIRAGHHPAHLVHCQGVQPQCAFTMMQQGQHPAHLVHCR